MSALVKCAHKANGPGEAGTSRGPTQEADAPMPEQRNDYEVVLMGGSYRIVVHTLRRSDEDGDFFVLRPVTPEKYATRQEAEEALDALR